jgi:hypothetical protein
VGAKLFSTLSTVIDPLASGELWALRQALSACWAGTYNPIQYNDLYFSPKGEIHDMHPSQAKDNY